MVVSVFHQSLLHMTVFLDRTYILWHVSSHADQCMSPLDRHGLSHLEVRNPQDNSTLHHTSLVAMLDLHVDKPCLRCMIDNLPKILCESKHCKYPWGKPQAPEFPLHSSSLVGNLYSPTDLRKWIKKTEIHGN